MSNIKIEKLVDYNKADYEVMGYYSSEEIYRIKNKLLFLNAMINSQ